MCDESTLQLGTSAYGIKSSTKAWNSTFSTQASGRPADAVMRARRASKVCCRSLLQFGMELLLTCEFSRDSPDGPGPPGKAPLERLDKRGRFSPMRLGARLGTHDAESEKPILGSWPALKSSADIEGEGGMNPVVFGKRCGGRGEFRRVIGSAGTVWR